MTYLKKIVIQGIQDKYPILRVEKKTSAGNPPCEILALFMGHPIWGQLVMPNSCTTCRYSKIQGDTPTLRVVILLLSSPFSCELMFILSLSN